MNYFNCRTERNTSPSNSIKTKLSRNHNHPKIKIPRNSKLSTFFILDNSKNSLEVSGKTKPV